MKKTIGLTTAVLILFASASVWAATLYVGTAGTPGGSYYTEIQAAVDAAVAGDLVLVSNGVYNTGGGLEGGSALTNRVYCAKAIEIRSVDGPAATLILGAPDAGTGGNGPGAVRGVCIPWNTAAILSGFTISNGYTLTTGDSNLDQGGGGVRARLASLVTNCVIIGNHANGRGGGLNLQSGHAYDCQIINNRSEANTGGGVFAQRADGVNDAEIYNCLIKDNVAANQPGGGLYIYIGSVISNSVISGNSCIGGNPKGGGVFVLKEGEVVDCTISGNNADLWGGGVCIEDTAHGAGGLVSRCKIMNNTTVNHGGAGAMLYNAGTIQDSLIEGNNSGLHGGGVFFVDGGTIINCTVVTNNAANAGGGIVVDTDCTIENCIILDNTASDANTPNWSKGPGGTSLYTCTLPMAMPGVGNIATNAYFVDAANGNFNLTGSSPCVNAGDNAYASSYDLDGKPRIVGGTVDMGCYEFVPEPATFGLLAILGLAFLRKK